MKLRNVAALFCRFVGVLIILGGLGEIIAGLISRQVMAALAEGIGFGVAGYFLVYYSEQLAVLLCKGLDD